MSALAVTDPQIHATGDDTLFVRSTVHGTAKASGAHVEFQLLQQVRTRNGRILEIRPFYWDTASVLQALTS